MRIIGSLIILFGVVLLIVGCAEEVEPDIEEPPMAEPEPESEPDIEEPVAVEPEPEPDIEEPVLVEPEPEPAIEDPTVLDTELKLKEAQELFKEASEKDIKEREENPGEHPEEVTDRVYKEILVLDSFLFFLSWNPSTLMKTPTKKFSQEWYFH